MVNEDQNKGLKSAVRTREIGEFTDEYIRYLDSFYDLVRIQELAIVAKDSSQEVYQSIISALSQGNTSGLKNAYNHLLDFERKYPFIGKNLSSRAREFDEIRSYLIERNSNGGENSKHG